MGVDGRGFPAGTGLAQQAERAIRAARVGRRVSRGARLADRWAPSGRMRQCIGKQPGGVSNATQTGKDSVSCRHAADAVGAACITWQKRPHIRGDEVNMKQQGMKHRGLVRLTQVAIASAAFAMLAACGGGSSSNNSSSSATPAGGVNLQVVSFGDSLSDVGTYSPVIGADFGGGRFTTNPGEIWTQKVAEYYGGTLTPAYPGGFGQPLAATGGLGYAQGGSDVVNVEGEGWAPNNLAATTVPVTTQVSQYLSAHGSFNANQLVLVNGGANDIFQFAT